MLRGDMQRVFGQRELQFKVGVPMLQAVAECNLRCFAEALAPVEGMIHRENFFFFFEPKRLDSTGTLPLPGARSNVAERQQQQGRERPRAHERTAATDTWVSLRWRT
jgi:hypothetical protein